MNLPRFIQIHTLHTYPAALLNRDDAGLAKRLHQRRVVKFADDARRQFVFTEPARQRGTLRGIGTGQEQRQGFEAIGVITATAAGQLRRSHPDQRRAPQQMAIPLDPHRCG